MSDAGSQPASSTDSVNASSSNTSTGVVCDDKAPLWMFVKRIQKLPGGGSCRWQCNICKMFYNGSYTRVRIHLLREVGHGVAPCSKVTTQQLVHMTKLVEDCKERIKNATSRQVPLPSSRKSASSSGGSYGLESYTQVEDPKKRKGMSGAIGKAFQNEAREQCNSEIARMFYTGGLSFNLATNPHFRLLIFPLMNHN